jgi:hypothetical protein
MTKIAVGIGLAMVAVAVACAGVQGGSSKCPPNAVCAWLDFGVGPIYVCTDPGAMTQLRALAHKESFE